MRGQARGCVSPAHPCPGQTWHTRHALQSHPEKMKKRSSASNIQDSVRPQPQQLSPAPAAHGVQYTPSSTRLVTVRPRTPTPSDRPPSMQSQGPHTAHRQSTRELESYSAHRQGQACISAGRRRGDTDHRGDAGCGQSRRLPHLSSSSLSCGSMAGRGTPAVELTAPERWVGRVAPKPRCIGTAAVGCWRLTACMGGL